MDSHCGLGSKSGKDELNKFVLHFKIRNVKSHCDFVTTEACRAQDVHLVMDCYTQIW